MREYMGKMHFGYLITVCARAEKECPTVFPGVGLKLTWLFDDPRGEGVPEEGRLEKFRQVRDQIEAKILHWLEHPEEEIERLEAERECERQQRLRAGYEEAEARSPFITSDSQTEPENVLVGLAYPHSRPSVLSFAKKTFQN